MVAYKIDTFGGMIPAVADELLPGNAAALSQDAWLYRGNLIGWPVPINLHTLVQPNTTKVFRIPESYGRSAYLYNSTWLEFSNPDTDVIRAPVFNDTHDRYYWASSTTPPQYNTLARIKNGDDPWLLGINPPGPAPVVSVAGGSVRMTDVRVATISAGTLATSFAAGQTVDGIVLALGNRILIKDLAGVNAKDNGVRIVTSGTPTRAPDMDAANEFVGRFVRVLEGTANSGTFWKCSNTSPPVVGTTPILFEETAELPLQVTRSYVYTWVTEYGEESAPSPPAIVSGAQDGTWNLTSIGVPDPLDQGLIVGSVRYITKTRIYRTVTSSNNVATFFLVTEIPCTTTSFVDSLTDDEVTQNALLESFAWTPPPDDLQGLTVMWNGMVAGFRENELWFCEPYRPHAWPASFVQTLEYPIIGLGVANQTLVACTAGNPVTINGSIPDNLTSAKIAKFEPCTSRGSILSSPNGVMFTSPNGLILCGQGGAINVTKDLLTHNKWDEYVGQNNRLRAAWLAEAYYAFGQAIPGVFDLFWISDPDTLSSISHLPDRAEPWVSHEDFRGTRSGIHIDPTNQRVAFNVLTSQGVVMNVQNDAWTSEVFIIRDGFVQWLEVDFRSHMVAPALWRSKIFQMPDKKNLGAMRVYFSATPELPALNPVRNVALTQTLAADQWGLCRVYADGRLILTRELRVSGELWRLPSGFLADFWQYEIETRLNVLSVQLASTAKELVSV